MYYLVKWGDVANEAKVLSLSTVTVPPSWYFDEPLEDELPSISMRLSHLRNLPDFSIEGPFRFASQRLLALLKDIGEHGFDDYPLVLKGPHGTEDLSFRLFRFRHNVKCLDLNASQYELNEDGDIRRIRRIALNEDEIPKGRHFFQLQERYTTYIASAEFHHQWSDRGLRGLVFFPVAEVDWWF